MNVKKIVSNLKKPLIGLLVALVLLEIFMRSQGARAGRFNDDFMPTDTLEYLLDIRTDSIGIARYALDYLPWPDSAHINRQGFRSDFDYDCAALDSLRKVSPRQSIVMMVGDSYVAGCCVDRFDQCFPDLLAQDPSLSVLNFGVSATDPQQYFMIAREFLPTIQPDLLVICVFLGNDILSTDLPPVPNFYPWMQPKGRPTWIASRPPDYLVGNQDICLESPEAATAFYLDRTTLFGPGRSLWDRLLGYTAIYTKLRLGMEYYARKRQCHARIGSESTTYKYLAATQSIAIAHDVQVQFVGIPSAVDVANQVNLEQTYGSHFGEIQWIHPPLGLLSPSDYDGTGTINHFTASGNAKFHEWLVANLPKRR